MSNQHARPGSGNRGRCGVAFGSFGAEASRELKPNVAAILTFAVKKHSYAWGLAIADAVELMQAQ
ncbi:hypothetical protein QQ045_021701 [Rhodiola kirilowii]